jgi:transcriptional regulator with XRE-family HTH domain
MKQNQRQMIAALVRDGRLAKGYTQKELSELSNISIRSIQRIENGEIVPRNYTLKSLAKILNLSFEEIQQTVPVQADGIRINKIQKIILSVGTVLVGLLLSVAFIAQSPTFPETHFEAFLFYAVVLAVLSTILTVVWRTKS